MDIPTLQLQGAVEKTANFAEGEFDRLRDRCPKGE
jgi:hypothetical protein